MKRLARPTLRLLLIAFPLLFFPFPGAGAEETALFTEDFTDSMLNLNWLPFPGFSQNSLSPIIDPDTPQGDLWAGRQTNEQLGGFASLSYAGMRNLKDYSIEAWVRTVVVPNGKAPLNGLAVRADPANGRFYRLASSFGKEPKLTFAYVGRDTHNYPVVLATWMDADVQGGLPKSSGWHKMSIKCVGKRFWAYWDGKELPGCPLEDDRIAEGYFGVYANYVGGEGVVETRVDAIRVFGASELSKVSNNKGLR